MKDLIKILKNYKLDKKWMLLLIFFWILESIFILLVPLFLQKIIEVIENKLSIENLYFWSSLFLLMGILSIILWYIYYYYYLKTTSKIFLLRNQFYRETIFDKNYSYLLDIWIWKLITRIDSWVKSESSIFLAIINIFIIVIIRSIVLLWIIIFYVPSLILILLVVIIIIFICNFYINKYIDINSKKRQEFIEIDWKNKLRIIMDNLLIRLFWKKSYELDKSKYALEKIPYYDIKIKMANEYFFSIIFFLFNFLKVFLLIFIWTLIIQYWEYDISYLVMLITYISYLWIPLENSLSQINIINDSLESYRKLQDFVNHENKIKNWKNTFNFINWKIEIRNLCFSYNEDKVIFENLNLEFLESKKNAIVWHSWSWKSSLINILLRLFDYKSGDIFIDWQSLKDIKIETLYKHIWYLPQEISIFDWSIRENLEYSFNLNSEKNDDIIWDALKKARMYEMVSWLKDWLDTQIWEKWLRLSWWERQRLAIARIFLKDPKIIILDEATSALDSISEFAISESLNELMKWKTSIIIAHRLQTVMNSDKIILIENWKIENQWKHKYLIENSETYKKLISLQSSFIFE